MQVTQHNWSRKRNKKVKKNYYCQETEKLSGNNSHITGRRTKGLSCMHTGVQEICSPVQYSIPRRETFQKQISFATFPFSPVLGGFPFPLCWEDFHYQQILADWRMYLTKVSAPPYRNVK